VGCSATPHCASVSLNTDYVVCDTNLSLGDGSAGVCRCLTELGFTGGATLSSKCFCRAPALVYRQKDQGPQNGGSGSDNTPYCVTIKNALDYENEHARENFLASQAIKVYESLVWPTPALIMQELIQGIEDGYTSTIFAPTASGRVDPLGEFFGYDGIVEYFYGTVWTGAARVNPVLIQKLVVEGDVVNIRVVLTINRFDPLTGTVTFSYNLTQTSTFTFNSAGLVQSAEMIIHNLAWIGDTQLNPPGDASIERTCQVILFAAQCNSTHDPNGYYTDFQDCIQFMHSIKYGTWGVVRDNSVVCRFYHSLMAIGRPNIHCPHTGKTGGSVCVPHFYEDYFKINF